MPAVPVYLATMAACGSLITSVKSSWELSRMARKKASEHDFDDQARSAYRKLRRAYEGGYMSRDDYDKWYENWLVCRQEKDYVGLRRVRAHLRVVYDNTYNRDREATKRNRERVSHGSSSNSSSSSHSGSYSSNRRRQSVAFHDPRRTELSYRPERERYRDIEWPTSAGSIEYYRNGDDRHAAGTQLARLQRRSSVSYPREKSRGRSRYRDEEGSGRGSDEGGSKRSKSSVRYEGKEGRGRSRKRWEEEEEEEESEWDDEGYETGEEEWRGKRGYNWERKDGRRIFKR